jgi:hypothetical protein
VPPDNTNVRFVLDPLAEYLAALYAIELGRSDDKQWRVFFEMVDTHSPNPSDAEEFLLALSDCCASKGKQFGVPDAVASEIRTRAGMTENASAAFTG